MRTNFTPIAIFVTLLLVVVLASRSFVVVQSGTVGAVRVLGKLQEKTLDAGFHMVVPFISAVQVVDLRQIGREGRQQCFTSDLQNTTIDYMVRYSIPADRVVELLLTFQGDVYSRLIMPKINEALEQVSSEYRADNIIKARADIRAKALAKLSEGVEGLVMIDDVIIPNIDLSAAVEQAIEQKMVQEQQALAKQFELEKAKRDAEIKIVTAEAEAKSVQITGEALAKVPQMIDLEVVKKWNGVAPQTVVIGMGSDANAVLPLVK